MPSVTIDAGVIAAPEMSASVDQVHEYVETLLDWRQLLSKTWIDVSLSKDASHSLIADKLYPLRPPLQRLFSADGTPLPRATWISSSRITPRT